MSSGKQTWTIVALVAGGLLLGCCCGGPALLYYFAGKGVATINNRAQEHKDRVRTPNPLPPVELLDWYYDSKPAPPIPFSDDPTKGMAEVRGVIAEANTGQSLRWGLKGEGGKRRNGSIKPFPGSAQLIIKGDTEIQEVLCWFKEADSISNVAVGQEVVVRGHISSADKAYKGGKNFRFTIHMSRCRMISN